MGLSGIRSFLKRHRRVALDTNVFIYQLEADPEYGAMAQEVFLWLERAGHSAVTSSITMTELLVRPYRAGNENLVNRYFGLLSLFPNLEWIAPDLAIADQAARIRAQFNLRTPDALQVATAIQRKATALLTNDFDMRQIGRIEVALLQDFH